MSKTMGQSRKHVTREGVARSYTRCGLAHLRGRTVDNLKAPSGMSCILSFIHSLNDYYLLGHTVLNTGKQHKTDKSLCLCGIHMVSKMHTTRKSPSSKRDGEK